MKKILFLCTLALALPAPPTILAEAESSIRKPLIIILFGPPGTGPGKIASRISDEMALPLISTSGLVQAYLSKESTIGTHLREALNSQGIIPDTLFLELIQDYIQKQANHSDFILDGIPQTLAQAESLKKELSGQFRFLCIYINLKDEFIVQRKTGRLICQNCGHVYHKKLSPPSDPLTCDQCDSPLRQRPDDTVENVAHRLADFHKRITPILDFFKKGKCLVEINANLYEGNDFPEHVDKETRSTIEKFDIDTTNALKLEAMLSNNARATGNGG
jgi:adenylate kinase